MATADDPPGIFVGGPGEHFEDLRPQRDNSTTSYSERVQAWGQATLQTHTTKEEKQITNLGAPYGAVGTYSVGSMTSRLRQSLIVEPEADLLENVQVMGDISETTDNNLPDNVASSTGSNKDNKKSTGAAEAPQKRGIFDMIFGKKVTQEEPRTPVSAIMGRKAMPFSVVPIAQTKEENEKVREAAQQKGVIPSNDQHPHQSLSFAPRRFLDIENGSSILVADQTFVENDRYKEMGKNSTLVVTAKGTIPSTKDDDAIFFQERGQSLQDKVLKGEVPALDGNSEVGMLGWVWRVVLKALLVATYDEVSALQMSRQIQTNLPFHSVYEAFLIGQMIEALDSGRIAELKYVLRLTLQNKNVSRVILQNLGDRWDFFWHWFQQVTSMRLFDAWGQLPVVGITRFPATENFPDTTAHARNSLLRFLLGPGSWITRLVTGGREGLSSDNPKYNIAQNLAAESNGFELANRSQFGNYIGRQKTNEFRTEHRLPVDESIVRSFASQPMSTMVNNGAVHTLRQLANHWHTMLHEPFGNFSHQRMEQLSPFETMRIHVPVVCVVLSSLRGRNKWDELVLGPFVQRCQELRSSSSANGCRSLALEMKDSIASNLSGGVASVLDPLKSWMDAVAEACKLLEKEAQEVYQEVTAVEVGIRLGYDLISQVSWEVPSDKILKDSIVKHIQGKNKGLKVSERRIHAALNMTTPRDKRTLIELVRNNLETSKPALLLLGRVKTLLQRDVRRDNLNQAIRELSVGDIALNVENDEWYWLDDGRKHSVYIYDAKVKGKDMHRFIHVDSGYERFVSLTNGTVKVRHYIPIAESISRAQRCYMNLELEHGKRFKYDAFMEFSFLRVSLRKLAIVSQLCCEEIDNARLNILREIQRVNQHQVSVGDLVPGNTYYIYVESKKSYEPFQCTKKYTPKDKEWGQLSRKKVYKVPPQSMIVIGGGPTGLLATVQCTENVLVSGGVMKLYEARDSFSQGGSTFERAQIVRLDARWISMLRYHGGTSFEDVFLPAAGETESQMGNTLPSQGFVELTIKDLENLLHVQVSKLWSKGVIQCFTDSRAKYDVASNSLTKEGGVLKKGDLILRRVDQDGESSSALFSWKVADVVYVRALGLDDLRVGTEYGVYIRLKEAVLPYKLSKVDLETRTYHFEALQKDDEDLEAPAHNLPSIYPKGTLRHADISSVVLQCTVKNESGEFIRERLKMDGIRHEKFTLDIGHAHVVECTGKPQDSDLHLPVTTEEPYGVCCMQGLKVSMHMHNFGETRWGKGILDDIRSKNDQNTRIIGDFTKMVRSVPIARRMHELMRGSKWPAHFESLFADSKLSELEENEEEEPALEKLKYATKWLSVNSPSFHRQTLQTRFFETGDNFYLGMELNREYGEWKKRTSAVLTMPLRDQFDSMENEAEISHLRSLLEHHFDRLWYEACLEVIRKGDVYNPGARPIVPHMSTISSLIDTKIEMLREGESFRTVEEPENKLELLIKTRKFIIVRTVEGKISKIEKGTEVRRESDLTRSPNGNTESKVAISTFPVRQYVNHRTVRLNNESKGYVFAFIGDEQVSPHFMRYSGMTGACINAMLLDKFVKQGIDGIEFLDRVRSYSNETNWSNSEVITRGTGSNFGRDGFLRPSFSYADAVAYLHSKILECMETQQNADELLSRDWQKTLAASLVPRGMELNQNFMRSLFKEVQKHIFDKIMEDVAGDPMIASEALLELLEVRRETLEDKREHLDHLKYWIEFIEGLTSLGVTTRARLGGYHCALASRVEQTMFQIVEHATKGHIYSERISSEMENEPKAVDSIVDDFAVEAQNFANSLMMSAAFASAALAFVLVDIRGKGNNGAEISAAILQALNILISFGTMVNVCRYKNRNEEMRILFFDERFAGLRRAVYSALPNKHQEKVPNQENPFVIELDKRVLRFIKRAEYYDCEDPVEFKEAYRAFKTEIDDPKAAEDFMRNIASYFIADVYHINSYLQEDLVEIYKVLDEMHRLQKQNKNRKDRGEAYPLYQRLKAFEPRLEGSLQRGNIFGGFFKHRNIFHWDPFLVLRFFHSLVCCSFESRSVPLSPIQTETYGIAKQLRGMSTNQKEPYLQREARDMEQLYWATRESDVASLIFCSAALVFLSSIVFTISRIITRAGGPSKVTDAAFWATIASTFGAILALYHFARKFFHLVYLWFALARKPAKDATTSVDDKRRIQQIRRVTFIQILLTLTRLVAAGAAAVALPWSVAENAFGDKIDFSNEIPYWVAVGAISSAVGSLLMFFIVEFVVRYNLSPRLGEYVCEAFREEIEEMYKLLDVPRNDIEPKQVQDRRTWEYVAREFLHKYRFDTVFAADRFGSILQYIQSGMDPRT